MTSPLEQASAILKAAEEIVAPSLLPSVHIAEMAYKHACNTSAHKAFHGSADEARAPLKNEISAKTVLVKAEQARNHRAEMAAPLALALIEKHKALEEACDLFRSICVAYENQDLSHVQFRVKCAEFARDFLSRQGETA